jgi:hypothetical protein
VINNNNNNKRVWVSVESEDEERGGRILIFKLDKHKGM